MKSFKHWSMAYMVVGVLLQGQGVAVAQQVASAETTIATDEATLREKLTGTWELSYSGTLVSFVFDDNDVNIMNMGPSPYELNDGFLSFEANGKLTTSRLSFNGDQEMLLENDTGTQVFKRVQ